MKKKIKKKPVVKSLKEEVIAYYDALPLNVKRLWMLCVFNDMLRKIHGDK